MRPRVELVAILSRRDRNETGLGGQGVRLMSYAIRVEPGKGLRLRDVPPDAVGGLTKDEALRLAQRMGEKVADLADLLFAAGMHSLLVVIQGRDTAGKDGVIRRMLGHVG
ncbi:MAG: hypothetical protein FJX72_08425, partial [Armatimonadetes bacterium]|nr:hypothetical protein [Armatimonadota bacterium]